MNSKFLFKRASLFLALAAMSQDQAMSLLKVKPGDSDEAINQSYRTLMKKYHPDKNKLLDTTDIATALNQARHVLLNRRVERAKRIDLNEETLREFEDLLDQFKIK